ncbi:hypothetical protein Peur_057467 [Populus x canadensis]
MIEFRRGILVDSFSSFSLSQRPKKSALVNNVQREIAKGVIGGGLVLRWKISILKDNPKILQIDYGIIARSIGAGSGGFSRLVCLRVHPTLTLSHPTETFVSFTSIDGSKHEIWPESGGQFYRENLLPNGTVNLELWSEDRPVSKQSPFAVSHGYEVIGIS